MNYIEYMGGGNRIERRIVYTAPNGNTIEAIRFKLSGLIKTIQDVFKENNDKNAKMESSDYPNIYNQGYITTATPQQNYEHFVARGFNPSINRIDWFIPINKQKS